MNMTMLGVGSLLMGEVGTGISVASQYAQSKAIRRQADYNQKMAQQQAERTRQDARENRRRMDEDNKRQLARLRSRYARLGLDESQGTPLDMFAETASKLELSIADHFTASERQAAALENRATLDAYDGRVRSRAAQIGGVTTALGGAADLAMQGFEFHDRLKPQG